MNKPNITVDFDGVLHSYESGWKGADEIPDPPVDGSESFLRQAVEEYTVNILSSRTPAQNGIDAMRSWCENHYGEELTEKLEFPETKPPYNVFTIDDRCFHFRGEFPEIEDIKSHKSWVKIDNQDPNKPSDAELRELYKNYYKALPQIISESFPDPGDVDLAHSKIFRSALETAYWVSYNYFSESS